MGTFTSINSKQLRNHKHVSSPVKHVSLVCVTSDQPVHLDGFVLTNPMTASLCLEVVLRVPVRVVDDDSVSCREVDTETPRTSAQQEHKAIRIWGRGGHSCTVFRQPQFFPSIYKYSKIESTAGADASVEALKLYHMKLTLASLQYSSLHCTRNGK